MCSFNEEKDTNSSVEMKITFVSPREVSNGRTEPYTHTQMCNVLVLSASDLVIWLMFLHQT